VVSNLAASRHTVSDITVRVEQLPEARDLPPPEYMTEHAAGMDLLAAVADPMTLPPGEFAIVRTGIRVAIPIGFEGQVRPRSGLAAKHGVTLVNAPGTIDADYRGEVHVVLINHGRKPFVVQRGDRIAQLVVAPVTRVNVKRVDTLDETARGSGGFGHTGR